MIVLDTNVISALMKAEANPFIVDWLNRLPPQSVWTTTVTLFELQIGIERLRVSRRRHDLEQHLSRVLKDDIEERLLTFDRPAAEETAVLAARRERVGRPIDFRDSMIAGIVMSRRAELATRNVRHFADLDVPVIDPWTA
ncbi:MAG: toxin FitB [Hyphomicrobiales bacterium]|jgi:predicted nucleic acid-binding protein|nr:toxin FitB [Hyphomicrobiales bacterium]